MYTKNVREKIRTAAKVLHDKKSKKQCSMWQGNHYMRNVKAKHCQQALTMEEVPVIENDCKPREH